ncbi:hypothetical protein BO86DRAFT_399967 [Aspergillus japonicus CBS 114.51]|uniref:Uncharacterized protein n=2 Tax=Aspergillus TaxID=5052 RepID=A0A2V5GZR3_ASPV1|nr:hypothetical protein BO86DRAFT_399967 [Aspergillus japonicus CBS 114.51]PYI17018.1 hypothetical protein BO99DRAFT_434869 [Aspergillus violaceofuscus CBS 115571]RAH81559.1 hypothetical protein BO86DRAFT_399967 [Aspergillus japonicus CBS 114.51]
MSFNITDESHLASPDPHPSNIDLLIPLTSIMLYFTLEHLGVITDQMRAGIVLAACGTYLASQMPDNGYFATNNRVVVETPTADDLEARLGPYPLFPHMWYGVQGDMAVHGGYGRDENEDQEEEDVGVDATPRPPVGGSFGVKKIVYGLILCFQWVLVPFVRGLRKGVEQGFDVGVILTEEEEKEEEEKTEKTEKELTAVTCETMTSSDELCEYATSLRASDALADESIDRWTSTFVINKAESIKEEELSTFGFEAPNDDAPFPPDFVSGIEHSDWDSLDDILDDYRSDTSCSPDFPSSHPSETACSTSSSTLVNDCKPAADSSNPNPFDPQPGSVLDVILDEYLSDSYSEFDDETELTFLPYSPTTSCPSSTSSFSTIDTDDFLTGTIDAKLSQIWPTDPKIDDAPLPYNLTHEPASPFDEVLEELERYIEQQQHAAREEYTTLIPRAIVPKKRAQTSISHPSLPRTATQSTPTPPHFNIAIPAGKKPSEPAPPAPASNSTSIAINPLQSCLFKPQPSSKRGIHRLMLEADSSPPSVNLETLTPLELDRLTRFSTWKNLFVNDISSPIYNHSQHRPKVSGPRSMHAACPPPALLSTRTKTHKSVRFHPAVTNIDIRICPRYLRTRRHRDPDGEVIERPVFSLIPLRE